MGSKRHAPGQVLVYSVGLLATTWACCWAQGDKLVIPSGGYPFHPGCRWEFRVEVGGEGIWFKKLTLLVEGTQRVFGKDYLSVKVLGDDRQIDSSYERREGDVMLSWNSLEEELKPRVAMRFPLKEGLQWDDAGEMCYGRRTEVLRSKHSVVKTETVEVPAGKFRCLLLRQELPDAGIVSDAWVAPGVGFVKFERRGHDQPKPQIACVLTRFTRETWVDRDIQEPVRWEGSGSPYVLTKSIRVWQGGKLAIEPGVVVKVRKGFRLWVRNEGTLIAEGTKEKPIVFTSAEEKPQPGDWDTLSTENTSGEASSLRYCTIQYASRGLWITNSSPSVAHCTIQECYGDGLALDKQADPSVSRCIIERNGASGIHLGPTAKGVLTTNYVSKNGIAGVCCGKDSATTLVSNTITGNAVGVLLKKGANPKLDENIVRDNQQDTQREE
ncbi:MAG: DUF1565 domain-containing protein [Planctomycetes bacterium]|nr:DUF1565 domain-containing protein [Planctomycetota bacterium]